LVPATAVVTGNLTNAVLSFEDTISQHHGLWQAIDSAIPMGLSVVEAGTRLLKDECPLAHCALCCLSRNGVRGDEKLARSGVSSAVTGIGNLGGIRLG
jgi:hypothetical protein